MAHECGACGGSGECQNDHHNLLDAMMEGGSMGMISDDCPACGQSPSFPGKCSVCGGEGEQDDDDD